MVVLDINDRCKHSSLYSSVLLFIASTTSLLLLIFIVYVLILGCSKSLHGYEISEHLRINISTERSLLLT